VEEEVETEVVEVATPSAPSWGEEVVLSCALLLAVELDAPSIWNVGGGEETDVRWFLKQLSMRASTRTWLVWRVFWTCGIKEKGKKGFKQEWDSSFNK
jgi:hypothetical protein